MPTSISTMTKDQRIIKITMQTTLIMGKEMMIQVERRVCNTFKVNERMKLIE